VTKNVTDEVYKDINSQAEDGQARQDFWIETNKKGGTAVSENVLPDKHDGLKDYGIIYVGGPISESTAEMVCKEIIEYNIAGKTNHIQLIINSPGGSVHAGFSIIDIMEWSRLPVYTAGIGIIASMPLLVFMTGVKGRRVITPRTSILSHRYAEVECGNHSQLLAGRKEQDLAHDRIVEHYLNYSSVATRDELEQYLLRDVDTWLSADEAINLGIADIMEPLGPGKRG